MVIPLTEKRSWMQLLKQCAIGCAFVAALTFVAYKLHFPIATVGFIYLLVVIIASISYGVWQAIFLSLIAVILSELFFSFLRFFRLRSPTIETGSRWSPFRSARWW